MTERKTVVIVSGYDNLLSTRNGFYIYDINNFGICLHNRETDEIYHVPHRAVLCYWHKTRWIYPATTKGGLICVKQLR